MTTSGRLVLPLSEPCIGSNDELQVGATLTIYIAGGSTLASLFADSALATPIANPQTSNAAGRFYGQSTTIFSDASQTYSAVLAFPDGESFTYDNLALLGVGSTTTGFAPLNSPALTGVPTAPTPALNDSTQKLATTAYVQGQGYIGANSPALTGTPTAPTAAAGTDSTQLATTAFVTNAIGLTLPTGPSSGYTKIGGLYLQWTPFSLGAAGGATQAVTWPIAFPTAVLGNPWIGLTNAALQMIGVNSPTTMGCTVQKGVSDTFARTGTVWAFGY